jgi:DNA-binding NarL/FixJ family response regulator
MNRISVVLAEDHHVVRTAIAEFLAKEQDIEVVGEVAEGDSLLQEVDRMKPDVLLLDAHMPGREVVESAETIRKRHPQIRILVLSAYDRREYVVGLLKAGAAGYVLKDDSPEMLLRALRAVAHGEEWVSPRVAKQLVESVRRGGKRPQAQLTEREMDVLQLMAAGLKNDEIAGELVITTQTVKNHVRSIFRKLEVETRVEAVLWALNHGVSGDRTANN